MKKNGLNLFSEYKAKELDEIYGNKVKFYWSLFTKLTDLPQFKIKYSEDILNEAFTLLGKEFDLKKNQDVYFSMTTPGKVSALKIENISLETIFNKMLAPKLDKEFFIILSKKNILIALTYEEYEYYLYCLDITKEKLSKI